MDAGGKGQAVNYYLSTRTSFINKVVATVVIKRKRKNIYIYEIPHIPVCPTSNILYVLIFYASNSDGLIARSTSPNVQQILLHISKQFENTRSEKQRGGGEGKKKKNHIVPHHSNP